MVSMEKKIIIIQHAESEGPGVIAEFFARQNWAFEICDLSRGERLPGNFDEIGAVISLGGPMNVYDETDHPFLEDEDRFIIRTIVEEIPFLGVCLGAQLLAKSCAANVGRASMREIGWYNASLTGEGRKDILFRDIPGHFPVFQWHEDTFDVPEKGVLLAGGTPCAHQAFRVGQNAYGLQFHFEVTRDMIKTWCESGMIDGVPDDLVTGFDDVREQFENVGAHLLTNFKSLVESSVRMRRVIHMFVEDETSVRKKRPILWWVKERRSLALGAH